MQILISAPLTYNGREAQAYFAPTVDLRRTFETCMALTAFRQTLNNVGWLP